MVDFLVVDLVVSVFGCCLSMVSYRSMLPLMLPTSINVIRESY